MKRMRLWVINSLIGLSLYIAGINMTSCSDYLDADKYFNEMTFLDSVFQRQELVDQYIRGAAGLLPNEGNLWTTAPMPFQGASDENFTSWNDDRHAAIKFLLDEITPFSGYFNNWGTYYQGIRKANIVLARINEVPDISDIDRRDYMGRCYFLRGYFYYLLLQQYGPVPILPETIISVDANTEDMTYERNTYDECIDYICQSMKNAEEYLPQKRESSTEVSIPTKGAAMATVSRVLLYAASPWYNGNKFYSDWLTSDGRPFISQTADNSRWGKAAVAAKRIIDTGLYKLYTTPKESDTPALPANVPSDNFPNGAGDIDPLRSYAYIFNGELPVLLNPEFIYSCSPLTTGDSPLWIATPTFLGGGNGLNLTQDIVDAYRMKDGHDINESSDEYPYPGSDEIYKAIGSGYSFSGYQLQGNTAKMYANREMRFYTSIGFCHSFWPGTSYTGSESVKNIEVTYYADGNAQPAQNYPDDYNRTGYTCKKYIHPEDNMKQTSAVRSKSFPIFRYAETLLNYAEALNEIEGSYTDTETGITVTRNTSEIKAAFNQIRFRAGLPGITDSELNSQTKVRELIKRERQVEFMCEGRRYHDLRRWGTDAMTAYNKPIRGMNVSAKLNNRQGYYTITTLSDKLTRRTFSYKNYFWPIPKSVLNKNSKLVQNPEW